MWSVGVNAILAFLMGVTLIFNLGNINSILATTTRQPFIQVFYNATQSYTAVNVMTAIVIILLSACCISEVATASRQIWSFARDGGLPGSAWLSKVIRRSCQHEETWLTSSQVSPGWNIPLRAVCVSLVVSSLLACINLGSSTALNAINSLGGVSILTSYFITISCLVWRRLRGPPLPPRRWSLGRFGLAINVAALMFLTPIWFFAFWPLATPVTAETMNWSSTMFGGTIIVALIYYFVRARHVYSGPVIHVKRVD
jgi:choline transport protein